MLNCTRSWYRLQEVALVSCWISLIFGCVLQTVNRSQRSRLPFEHLIVANCSWFRTATKRFLSCQRKGAKFIVLRFRYFFPFPTRPNSSAEAIQNTVKTALTPRSRSKSYAADAARPWPTSSRRSRSLIRPSRFWKDSLTLPPPFSTPRFTYYAKYIFVCFRQVLVRSHE